MPSKTFFNKILPYFLAGALLFSGIKCSSDEKPKPEIKGKYYSTGNLEGRKFADLYSMYTGIKGKVPEKAKIDFEKQLNSMWEKKIDKYGNRVAEDFFEEAVKNYNLSKAKKISLEEYILQAQEGIDEINENLDWKKISKIKKLNKKELRILKKAASSLNGRDLVSYSLTELMPSTDGELNENVLEFLLENAGVEYVKLIPAMHDRMASFGPYQFTSYAVYDVGIIKNGASITNQALPPEFQIPGSVTLLRGEEHHKAAYLFAINNLANLINNLTNKQKRNFDNILDDTDKKSGLVGYIATAHHLPRHAIYAGMRWLDNKARGDFHVSCTSSIKDYAKKTEANLRALENGI